MFFSDTVLLLVCLGICACVMSKKKLHFVLKQSGRLEAKSSDVWWLIAVTQFRLCDYFVNFPKMLFNLEHLNTWRDNLKYCYTTPLQQTTRPLKGFQFSLVWVTGCAVFMVIDPGKCPFVLCNSVLGDNVTPLPVTWLSPVSAVHTVAVALFRPVNYWLTGAVVNIGTRLCWRCRSVIV